MEDTAVIVAFYVLSIVTLGSALMVATVRDLVHAVLFLVLSFIGVAGLYITLSADFVAVVQVLIYVGAISVLMLFAILLTPRSDRDNASVPYAAPIGVLAGLVGAVIIFVALKTEWAKAAGGNQFETTAAEIGKALLDPFVIPFEVASVLLVVAMLGAILLVHPGNGGGETG
jgi:NADH:ubiquinone oxidoreductase subunit 6 (subunit J)